jgi:hypothetical protein
MLLQLLVQGRKVGEDTFRKLLGESLLSKECSFHSLVVPAFGRRPRDLGRRGLSFDIRAPRSG